MLVHQRVEHLRKKMDIDKKIWLPGLEGWLSAQCLPPPGQPVKFFSDCEAGISWEAKLVEVTPVNANYEIL